MGEGIKSFDLFRYTPTKFLEQTISGALISLSVVGIAIWLALHEWNVVFNDDLKSEVIFDNLHMQDLEVKLEISLFNIPCDIVDLRFTSKKGKQHTVQRFDETQEQLRLEYSRSSSSSSLFQMGATPEKVAEKIKNKIGCRIKGTFYMHFLANHFNVGFGNHQMLAKVSRILKNENQSLVMDLSHKIHKLVFGSHQTHTKEMRKYFGHAAYNTLKDHSHTEIRLPDDYKGPYYHRYYLDVIHNSWDSFFGIDQSTFQYTAAYYSQKSMTQNLIAFIINVNPMTIHYYKETPNILSVFVQIFSILGGLFMIARVLDTYISSLWNPVKSQDYESIPLGNEAGVEL